MRKMFLFVLVIFALLASLGLSAVMAQEATPLPFGEYVEGELSSSTYEVFYSFEGSAGDVVSIEMFPKPGTYDLDPYIFLRDPSGQNIGENDDFGYPLSLVVAELPADGTYTILATRSGGSTGSSEGAYWIRVNQVELATPGSTYEATIQSDSEQDTPNLYFLRPAESGPVTIGFSQTVGDLFASVQVVTMDEDFGFAETVAELGNTSKVSSASMTLELEGGKLYVIRVDRSFLSFVFEESEATVTITIS